MAISSISILFSIIFMLFLTSFSYVNGCYTSIISFGDSLADTGNLKRLTTNPTGAAFNFLYPPYGETFFHEPTGRCSNGRLIIDFLAESLGLPLIPAYADVSNVKGLRQGVNYAVAGATALDTSFHEDKGVHNHMTNASLRVQLEWFKQSLPLFCSTMSDCKQLIGRSLILMGEIGGNDYNDPLIAGKSLEEVESYTPVVINAIISSISELIELGAKTIVVPGNLPFGCSALYLTFYHGLENVEYDGTTGCLIRLNKIAEYHNELLQTRLNQIKEIHPDVNVIYADYYNAAMQFFRSPNQYGFINGALKACCGGSGPFNVDLARPCGDPASTTCAQPNTYVNWDGIHLTEAAYKVIHQSLFQGSYTIPQFSLLCPNATSDVIGGFSVSL